MKNKTIGILGGMGPEASGYLYTLLIEKSARDFGAKNNEDFPNIILNSASVPDFISSKKNRDKTLQTLKEKVIELNKLSITYISIACNSAHILFDELQSVSNIPFISIIDVVIAKVMQSSIKSIGILATPATLRAKLYQEALLKIGIKSIVPTTKEIKQLEQIIRKVISNSYSSKDKKVLTEIALSLEDRGAEGIILGCTELPILFPKKFTLPSYNSVEILAEVLLQKYYE